MKKTLIAMATLSTIITAQAGEIIAGPTSSSQVVENGGAILVDNRTRIKQYPEISVANSLRGTGINVVESSEQLPETFKRTGEITVEPAREGYTSAKIEKVYTKTFLGIPYDPVNVVVEPAKPIFFGYMYFNNLTCANGYNNGRIDLYSHHSTSIIPIIFCPNNTETKIELKIETFSDDTNKAVVLLGGQKINVEKGHTSIYNLRYDDHNVANIEFIYQQDEHPIRY